MTDFVDVSAHDSPPPTIGGNGNTGTMEPKITTILLTGPPGVGKTTLIRKIYNELKKNTKLECNGFYTTEVRSGNGPRIGFDAITLQDIRCILARENPNDLKRRPKVGKYSVYVQEFERLALPLLESEMINKDNLLVIDEIGKMEILSKSFERAIIQLLEHRQPLLATVPYQTRQPIEIVEHLKTLPGSKMFVVTKANRDRLLQEIVPCINQMFVK